MKQAWKLSLFGLIIMLVTSLACNLPINLGQSVPDQADLPSDSSQDLDQEASPTVKEAISTSTVSSSPDSTVIPTPIGLTIEDLMVACPSPEEIASVDQDLKLDFVNDITAGTYVCSAADGSVDLTLIEKNLYHAILAMRWIEFDEPLPWTELSLYDWFVQAVNGVIVDSREEFSHCCTNEGMIILGLGDNSFTAHTDRFLRDEVGQGGFDGVNGVDTLVQLLAHEARHNDGEGHPHTCENSNDKTIAEMGSFAIDYYLYRWFADHTDPEFMRSQVRLHDWYDEQYTYEANWMLNYRFCDEPSYTPSP
jgi:hypothetical protein